MNLNCSACSKPLEGDVLVCGDCRMAHYCSEACGTRDHENHHILCSLAIGELVEGIKTYPNFWKDIYFPLEPGSKLGSGAYSNVYKVKSRLTEKYRAIKILKNIEKEDITDTAREYAILKILNQQCSSTMKVYEFGYVPGKEGTDLVVVLQFIDGPTLDKLPLTSIMPAETRKEVANMLVDQLIEQLRCIHLIGLTHGDIKLENIKVEMPNGRPVRAYFIDFGFACALTTDLEISCPSVVRGTPMYLAPEGYASADTPQTIARDLWSFGIAMYIFLSGDNEDDWADGIGMVDLESVPGALKNFAGFIRMTMRPPSEYLETHWSMIRSLLSIVPKERELPARKRRMDDEEGETKRLRK